MIRIDAVWLALGASDLRGGIDRLLALVVRGFALGAQAHHAYVFANRAGRPAQGAGLRRRRDVAMHAALANRQLRLALRRRLGSVQSHARATRLARLRACLGSVLARGIRKPSQWCDCARFDPAFLAFIYR